MTELKLNGHDVFVGRVKVTGEIVLDTAMHLGRGGHSGMDPSATDSPVLLDSNEMPLIPGSSLKGAIRSRCESLLRGMRPDKAPTLACNPFGLNPEEEKGDIPACITRKSMDDFRKEKKKPSEKQFLELLERELCMACRVYGSPWFASRTLVGDAKALNWEKQAIENRDGVGIDRDSGAAARGIKFDFEVVPAGTRFKVDFIAENLSLEEQGVFFLGLVELQEGNIELGGIRSRGLGRVHMDNVQLEVTTPLSILDEQQSSGEPEGEIRLRQDEHVKQALEALKNWVKG